MTQSDHPQSGDSPDRPLKARDAERFGDEIARVAAAGLPLDQGLESAARELPPGRLSRALVRLAVRIRAGESVEAAINAEGDRIPAHLRGLLAAGVGSGANAADTLHSIVFEARRAAAARKRLRATLAYPAFLVFLMLVLVCLFFVYCFAPMNAILSDFDVYDSISFYASSPGTNISTAVDAMTFNEHWGQYIAVSILVAYVGVILLVVLFGSQRWMRQILHRVPVVGPVLRWSAVEQLASLLAQLIDAKTPLPEALQLSAEGIDDARVAKDCSRMAAKSNSGASLSDAMRQSRSIPFDVATLVAWGEKSGSLSQSLRTVSEIFGAKARLRMDAIAILAPAAAFFFIGGGIISFFAWQMQLMLSVIGKLV